jgi:hypothetical protein
MLDSGGLWNLTGEARLSGGVGASRRRGSAWWMRQSNREPRPTGLPKDEFTVPDDFNGPLSADVLWTFEGK